MARRSTAAPAQPMPGCDSGSGASVIGIVIGGRLADRVPQALLRKGFGWLVLGMAGFLIFKQLS